MIFGICSFRVAIFKFLKNWKLIGNPEKKKMPNIIKEGAQNVSNLKFNFQGSPKKHIRVAISQKGLVELFSFSPNSMF